MYNTFSSVCVVFYVSRERIEASDDGVIPGDQLGAGGLDSSLFSHLYRNWFRSVKIDKKVRVVSK